MNETPAPQGQPPEETGVPLWVEADYEPSVKWDREAVEEVRDAIRYAHPYIDEATPEEVMRFAVELWFGKEPESPPSSEPTT